MFNLFGGPSSEKPQRRRSEEAGLQRPPLETARPDERIRLYASLVGEFEQIAALVEELRR